MPSKWVCIHHHNYGCSPSNTPLGHVLRLLATHHILREVKPNVFANNRVSSAFDTGKNIEDILAE
jgi:hypothetical protein